MIKLIALDLDDTLLLPDCTIPPEAVDCLKQAADRGVQVMIATGRIFPSAEGYARQLGTDCPIVCYNGAMIRRPGEAATYAAYLDPALMHRVAVYCRERGLYLQMYSNDEIVVEKLCDATLADPDSRVTAVREIGDLTRAELEPSPKMMILDTPERLVTVRQELKARFGEQLHLATSKDYLLEMMPQGVSKRETLARYAAEQGIRREEAMVCGDNTNDVEMVAWAGLGVAVANAVPELKTVAAYVARAERSFGVVEAVRKFVLS